MNMKKSIVTSHVIAIFLVLLLFFTFNCDIVDNQRDIPEIKYDEIQIGTQFWMDRNLSETHYRNGDPIPLVTDREEWESLETGAYCYYDNNENNIDSYGLLYNWYAVADTRNIAPEHWHIPSDDEWKILLEYLGGEEVAGNILKESGTEYWNCPISNTNESGFSALPGGSRQYNKDYKHYNYIDIGMKAVFWSNSLDELNPWRPPLCMWLYCDSARVFYGDRYNDGYSVRCIKDIYELPLKSESQDVKKIKPVNRIFHLVLKDF